MSKGFVILIVLCVLGATSAGATAVAPPAQDTLGRQDLDALVADAKKTMMADPKAALQKAQERGTHSFPERGKRPRTPGITLTESSSSWSMSVMIP